MLIESLSSLLTLTTRLPVGVLLIWHLKQPLISSKDPVILFQLGLLMASVLSHPFAHCVPTLSSESFDLIDEEHMSEPQRTLGPPEPGFPSPK